MARQGSSRRSPTSLTSSLRSRAASWRGVLGRCERAQTSATAQPGTDTHSWRCLSARETNGGSRERARSRCTLQVRWSTAGRTTGAAATRSGRATSAQLSTSPTAPTAEGSYPSHRTIIRHVCASVHSPEPRLPRGFLLQPWVVLNGALLNRMELNGARSNPRLQVQLARLERLHARLLRKAAASPRQPRSAPATPSPVLATVTCVLELAGNPMQTREIHAAAEQLGGKPLLRTSVKGTLAAYGSGRNPRFRRLRRGVYEIAGRGNT